MREPVSCGKQTGVLSASGCFVAHLRARIGFRGKRRSCVLTYALLCRRLIPVTDNYKGDAFFTIENGKRVATPLLLVLAVVELSDVVFAVDSIPAVSFLSSH